MFTIFNEDENEYQLVEEPDPLLTYTYADYLQWKFEEQVELIRGRIYKMAAPRTKHQAITGRLFGEMYSQFKGHPCHVFVAPFDVRLPVLNRKQPHQITTVVQPDVCVVCDAVKIDELGCIGAPDVVIEVLSPGNSQKDIRIKHAVYEGAGVKEYWVVYPEEESIAVFILNAENKFGGATLYASGEIIDSTAVAGLKIHLKDIFI
jgi:Uma2 family endonuclease